jgi:hypothetical protein
MSPFIVFTDQRHSLAPAPRSFPAGVFLNQPPYQQTERDKLQKVMPQKAFEEKRPPPIKNTINSKKY